MTHERAITWRSLAASTAVHVALLSGAALATAYMASSWLLDSGDSYNLVVELSEEVLEPAEELEPEWKVEPMRDAEFEDPVVREVDVDEPLLDELPDDIPTTLVEVTWWTETLELPGFDRSDAAQPVAANDATEEPQATEASVAKPETPKAPVSVLPKLVTYVKPSYPDIAERRGWTGEVVCKLVVDAQGKVASAEVATSSGRRCLDDAAIEAVLEWRFDPGTIDGRPESFDLYHRVIFKQAR